MTLLFYIGCGGFLGTVLRYGLMQALQLWIPSAALAVLAVNALGCLAIGALLGYGYQHWTETTLKVLGVGVLGGFTTYSAFSAESLLLLKEGRWSEAFLYMAIMLIVGLGCCAAGFWVSHR